MKKLIKKKIFPENIFPEIFTKICRNVWRSVSSHQNFVLTEIYILFLTKHEVSIFRHFSLFFFFADFQVTNVKVMTKRSIACYSGQKPEKTSFLNVLEKTKKKSFFRKNIFEPPQKSDFRSKKRQKNQAKRKKSCNFFSRKYF